MPSAIVTTSYQPKRAPRKKRKQPAMVSRIVTPAKVRPGPPKRVIRLNEQASEADQPQPRRSVIVEPKRTRTSLFGDAPDLTEDEHVRAGEAAEALWAELVRRAARGDDA
jgi:hypothetical protein